MFLKNLINQTITNGATGVVLTLGPAVTSFVSMQDAGISAPNDQFFYCIVNGNNREVGFGQYTASNKFTRLRIFEILNNGVYTVPVPPDLGIGSAIDADGGTVAISPSLQGLTQHFPVWKHQYAHVFNTHNAFSAGANPPVRGFETLVGDVGVTTLLDDGGADSITDFMIAAPSDILLNTPFRIFAHLVVPNGATNSDTANLKMTIATAKSGGIFAGAGESIENVGMPAGEGTYIRREFFSGGLSITLSEPTMMIAGTLKRTTSGGVEDSLGVLGVSIMYQSRQLGTPGNGIDTPYDDWQNV